MSKNELVAKIEALNEWEALMEEARAEAEAIRDSIKAEMMEREVEELTAGSTSSVGLLFSPTASTLLASRRSTATSTKPLRSRPTAVASPSPADREALRPQRWGRRGWVRIIPQKRTAKSSSFKALRLTRQTNELDGLEIRTFHSWRSP